jgi:hypothetical protein
VLDDARGAVCTQEEGEEVVVSTELTYRPGEPVEVVGRKRSWRFDVFDGGRAVELAGRPTSSAEVAERVVAAHALNVNRRDVVFVQSNKARLEGLVERVAECSAALFQELLEHD